MATFRLEFRTDNDAFKPDEGSRNAEIARILREVANRIENGDQFNTFRNVHDSSGNIVGVFALKEKL